MTPARAIGVLFVTPLLAGSYRTNRVLPGVPAASTLRAGMEAQHPR